MSELAQVRIQIRALHSPRAANDLRFQFLGMDRLKQMVAAQASQGARFIQRQQRLAFNSDRHGLSCLVFNEALHQGALLGNHSKDRRKIITALQGCRVVSVVRCRSWRVRRCRALLLQCLDFAFEKVNLNAALAVLFYRRELGGCGEPFDCFCGAFEYGGRFGFADGRRGVIGQWLGSCGLAFLAGLLYQRRADIARQGECLMSVVG